MVSAIIGWINEKEEEFLGGSSNNARFMRGTFWLTSSTLISLALGMVVSIAIARIIGKSAFGQFGMVVNTVAMLGTFAGLGLGVTSTKYVAEFRSSDPARALRIVKLNNKLAVFSGGIVSLLLFIFASPLSTKVLNAPELANMLRLGTVLLFFNTLNGTQTGALSGLEAFKTVTKVNFQKGLVSFPITLIATYFFGLSGAVSGTVLSAFAGWLINHLALDFECRKASLPQSSGKLMDEISILWKFSLPALLGSALAGPVLWIASTILANQPEGYGELGLVNAANQWRNFVLMLPSIFCSAALPILASKGLSADNSNSTLNLTQKVTIAVVIPVYSVILFFGDFVMGLYGNSFLSGYPVLTGITLAICLMAIASVGGTNLAATGKMWFGFFLNLAWGAVLLVFMLLFAGRWGAQAYAAGYLLSYLVLLIMTFWYIKKLLTNNTLICVALSVIYLFLITVFALSVGSNMRLFLSVPFTILSLFVSCLVLGRTYTLSIIHRLRSSLKL